jgi:uncharacterized NAD-dependent epimerase/dehydratase family protein
MRGVAYPLPSIGEVIERTVIEGKLTNPHITCIGIAINTEHLDQAAARRLLDRTGREYDLPCVDPIRTGAAAIIDRLQALYPR